MKKRFFTTPDLLKFVPSFLAVPCAVLAMMAVVTPSGFAQEATAPAANVQEDVPQRGFSFAQEAPAPAANEDVSNPKPPEDIILDPGPLAEVIKQMESTYTPAMDSMGMDKDTYGRLRLPTVLYGPGTEDLPITASLRLRDVWPVDALALIVAAANCSLEPIYPAASGGGTPRLIGYRIVASPSDPVAGGGSFFDFGAMGSEGEMIHGMEAYDPLAAGLPAFQYTQEVQEVQRLQQEWETLERQQLLQQLEVLRRHLPEEHPKVVQIRSLLGQAEPDDEKSRGVVGIGLALAKQNEDIIVQEIVPKSPASRSGAIQQGDRITQVAEANEDPTSVSELELKEVVELIRGKPGSEVRLTLQSASDPAAEPRQVTVVREELNLPHTTLSIEVPTVRVINRAQEHHRKSDGGLGYSGQGGKAGLADGSALSLSATLRDLSASDRLRLAVGGSPTVRVYPLGSLLLGSGDDVKKQEEQFNELVASALEMAKEGGGEEGPALSFHSTSKTLIAKATESQHQIIEQVIQALTENASGQSDVSR